MGIRRRWGELSRGTRRLLVIGAIGEGLLKAAALIDLKRRPADQVRGRKWLWATVVMVANSAGLVPICYFVLGRRRNSGG
jgi:hypothetical protein